ncbi:MAG: hypothetical protein JNL70_10340 [Saprospiraceae bacterium]|nr:hypothetical protein [Saprospiraceae bacterium]
MNKYSFIVASLFLFMTPMVAQENIKERTRSKNIFKIAAGTHYFKDEYAGNILGFNAGLIYERTFAKKWSWSIGLEAFFNKNQVPQVKLDNASYIKMYGDLTLPEQEQRLALSPEIRYYFKRAGAGWYLSNIANIQYARHSRISYSHIHSYQVRYLHSTLGLDNTLMLSDRVGLGYQTFINQKIMLGMCLAYEFRDGWYKIAKGPQFSVQIGFNQKKSK